MKTLKNDWLIWLVILIPLPFIGFFWKSFPEQIPIHFNSNGIPDDYGDKTTGLFLLPFINICLYFLFILLPKIDPSRKNYSLFQDKFKIIRIALHTFLSFIFMITAFYSLGYHFNNSLLILYSITFLVLLIGNYMGNIRHNYFIGIRTPWTLASEEIWIKTHRLAAKIYVIGSLAAMVILPFIPAQKNGIAFITYIIIISMIPVIYSYNEFRKMQRGKTE